ncbi:type II CAAX endopeptidase family protein [Luteimonas vadosa]|uniref:CAAX prenyl protease 2/Lysostaphin resistance protein A-like domain-containing protein n=1 Tax=Luteimonas vadosa TaxID=1165507 RepID=A0ABP9DRJ3_9GAMM
MDESPSFETGQPGNDSGSRPIAVVELVAAIGLLASGVLAGVDTYVVVLAGWLSLRLRRLRWADVGLRRPRRMLPVLLAALVVGSAWVMFDAHVVEPWLQSVTGTPVDLSRFSGLVGNTGNYLLMLLVVWGLVAIGEELAYRGYLLNRLVDVFGSGRMAWAAALLVTSVVFGVAHGYQGLSGILATGYVGLGLGLLYLAGGRNLWLPILVHGVYDTVGLTLIYLGAYPAMAAS